MDIKREERFIVPTLRVQVFGNPEVRGQRWEVWRAGRSWFSNL